VGKLHEVCAIKVDEFYSFMRERESIRLRKEVGEPWPWTKDKILQTYKFTNVNREHDRTTRWMREHWTEPNLERPLGEQLFNCAFFRYFGTMEFAEAAGWQVAFDNVIVRKQVTDLAKVRLANKQRVFTGAYVITNQGISAPKQEVVCELFLLPLWNAVDDLCKLAQSSRSWKVVANELMKLTGFGGSGFMAKEVLQDAIHTPVLENLEDRNTWCPIGPGARRGLNRVFSREIKAKASFNQMLDEMIELYEHRDKHWDIFYTTLDLHCIQFQLCEFDKYERVRLGQGRPRSRYKRRD
jgi:hypothetical protein